MIRPIRPSRRHRHRRFSNQSENSPSPGRPKPGFGGLCLAGRSRKSPREPVTPLVRLRYCFRDQPGDKHAMELDLQTAIGGTVQFAIGCGFWRLGQHWSESINWPVGRALLSWPCYILAFIFVSSAVVTILWNMVGSIVLWVWSFWEARR